MKMRSSSLRWISVIAISFCSLSSIREDEVEASSLLDQIPPLVAQAHAGQHLVADRAGGPRGVVEPDVAAEKFDIIASPDATLWQIGDVEDRHVHGDAAGDGHAVAGDKTVAAGNAGLAQWHAATRLAAH